MEDYYNIFNISSSATIKEILNSYENKINKFNSIRNLSNEDIKYIKLLKSGLYILTNKELRQNYDYILHNEPKALNQNEDETLDSLFNVDNSWMNTNNEKEKAPMKKVECNVISDRIFSLSGLNRRPGYSTESEIGLRKPEQSRNDKTETMDS
jgi:DnaJ-class molecular chaperone